MSPKYVLVNDKPICLSDMSVSADDVLSATTKTNDQFAHMGAQTRKMSVDIFGIIDFRVFSGMVGEAFAAALERQVERRLAKNPSIDGYPDLLQNSTEAMTSFLATCQAEELLDYKYGGIEVKNTFGTKKAGSPVLMGDQRIGHINKKLDWKAHHRETNSLLALFSDYYQGSPTIAAVFYSDTLAPDDWQEVQRPRDGSTMTSFSAIKASGCEKLRSGMILCLDDPAYRRFFRA